MDVQSLYSNILHKDGLNDCKVFMENTGTDADSVVKLTEVSSSSTITLNLIIRCICYLQETVWVMGPDSGVFTYTNEDGERILEGVKSNATFLSTPSLYDLKLKYENVTRKFTTAELHLITLSEYYRVKKIPRGLRSNIRPNLMSNDASFCLKFSMISNKYGLDIILLNIEYLQQETKKLKCDISSVEMDIKSLLSEEEWNTFKESIKIKIDKLRLELEDVKRRKWNRDMDDYKDGNIYNWQRDISGGWKKRGYWMEKNGSSYCNDGKLLSNIDFFRTRPYERKNENRKRGGKKHRRQQKREKREKQIIRKTDGDKEQRTDLIINISNFQSMKIETYSTQRIFGIFF
ncbi:uncharacterized protein LOC143817240 [Ranitomeya variabilis]|uniref:uncharacterized protein LOC143817240 n=1 Tax=Ranitomeya variabilis TaxID=490064 RepID=UPI004055FE75